MTATPPKAPGQSEPSWALPAPVPRRRRGRRVVVLGVVLVLVWGGIAAILVLGGSGGRSGWDARLAPIAHEVEQLRKLRFEHPVRAEFLSDAAFRKRVTVDNRKLTRRERRELAQAESELRALGLLHGKVDLLAAENTLQGEDVLAFYDQEAKRIVVRGTTLDVGTRVTVAHELTHALQDQHFDLGTLDDRATKGMYEDTLTALVEGDAVRTEEAFVGTLSQAEQDAYDRSQASQAPDQAKLRDVPAVLKIVQEAPYDFGPQMIGAIVADGGERAVDAAFRHPPTTEKAFVDPASLLRRERPHHVPSPTLQPGERRVGRPETLGAFGLYLTLASRLDPITALHATDAWGGDREVDYRKGTTPCVRVAFTGQGGRDTTTIADALESWAATGPASTAQVVRTGRLVTLDACDPGAAGPEPRRFDAVLQLALGRNEIFGGVLEGGIPARAAECIADRVVEDQPLFQAIDAAERSGSELDAAATDQLRQLAISCRTAS